MQQSTDFQTTAHAKWILSGEHAVMRGGPALVFPIPSKAVTLFYSSHDENTITAHFNVQDGKNLAGCFWETLKTGLNIVDKKFQDINGHFFLENNIPMGAGLGFSAALCVVIARWFLWKEWILQDELFEFARKLEDNFHGKSSGADIAGVINNKGIYYRIGADMRPIYSKWQPQFYLSYAEEISVTATCVKKVKELWDTDKILAQEIDQDMIESVSMAETALQMKKETGLVLLQQAIIKAYQCFERWGLIKGNLQNHCKILLEAGALAVKPTGAGSGYILSLWPHVPLINNLPFELISAFNKDNIESCI
jgi:mevalonate kinase